METTRHKGHRTKICLMRCSYGASSSVYSEVRKSVLVNMKTGTIIKVCWFGGFRHWLSRKFETAGPTFDYGHGFDNEGTLQEDLEAMLIDFTKFRVSGKTWRRKDLL